MTLSITVLGSSGSYASVDNPCTGYLVQSEQASVLLDAGPGTLGPLQQAIDLRELDAIVLTHCHPDHWLELPVIRNVFSYFVDRSPVAVYGTAETKTMYDAIVIGGADDAMAWATVDATSSLTIGDQAWSFALADHPVETLAPTVVSGGKRFVFTSDSGPGWKFDSTAGPIDLALMDASHLSDYENLDIPHMSARQAGERARAAEVKRLVITHLVPGSEAAAHRAEAEAAYGGPVDVALSGDTFTL